MKHGFAFHLNAYVSSEMIGGREQVLKRNGGSDALFLRSNSQREFLVRQACPSEQAAVLAEAAILSPFGSSPPKITVSSTAFVMVAQYPVLYLAKFCSNVSDSSFSGEAFLILWYM